jgi:hypothetical protein
MQEPKMSFKPDVDIEEEVTHIVRSFPPLGAYRTYFRYKSEQGMVKLTGNVGSPQAKRVLVNNAQRIQGIAGVDFSDLWDDEEVRYSVGLILPPGVYATVNGGVVALTGKAPAEVNKEVLIAAVTAVPGVRRVGVVLE